MFKNSNNAESFIKSKAFKIVSSDANDAIIPDLASLKSGIAINIFNIYKDINQEKKNILQLIFEEDLEKFYSSLIDILNSILEG
jgi:hypothetical protein